MFVAHELQPEHVEYLARVRRSLRGAPQEIRDQAVDYASTLMERGFPVLFDRDHLAYVTETPLSVLASLAAAPRRFYSFFRIRKRGGGSRLIAAPTPSLKHVQHWVHREALSNLVLHPASHGFTRGRSIASNAEPHVGASNVLKLDLLDFFGSISRARVYRIFRRIGYSRDVANLLASLTTLGGALPQGAPTSPDLANAAAERMDRRLASYAAQHDLAYTRYADDLTFSGEFLRVRSTRFAIDFMIRDEGFRPNDRKARYLRPHQRQLVTGVVVNERLNANRQWRRALRQEVHYLKRFGVEDHTRYRGVDHARYKEHVYGQVYALNSLRPDEAQTLLDELAQVDWPY
jgi:RNA-directed DNA polymerase